MQGDPPSDDFVLAYRLGKDLEEVTQMDEWQRLGWDNFFQVRDVLGDLVQRTNENRR
jgi:hypothetical protein